MSRPAGVVAVAGEALVDIVVDAAPGRGHVELVPGGSPANVAVGLARLGVPARLLARIADDLLGRRLRAHLTGSGVDLSRAVAATEPTSLALVEVGPDGAASYDFRIDGTADWQWTPTELDGAMEPGPHGAVVALHCGSLALTVPPGAAALRDLVARAAAALTISYDPNCRPLLMGDRVDVLRGAHEVLAVADVVKVSADDLAWLAPGTVPGDVVDDWVGRGAALVAVTLGADGVLAGTATGLRTRRPARRVDVVDTVGAGDSFSAALLAGLFRRGLLGAAARADLRTIPAGMLDAVLDEAAAAAAVTCSHRGAIPRP